MYYFGNERKKKKKELKWKKTHYQATKYTFLPVI